MKTTIIPLEEIIPFDSDRAARLTTVTGWVSRNGHFYGDDERTARYDGCTHKPCADCGALIRRDGLVCCQPCFEKRDAARFAEMPREEWDGETPIVIFNTDTYFFGEDDLDDYCTEHDVARETLRLAICTPQTGRHVDAMDLFEDVLVEDASEYDIPDPIREAVEQLNKAIEAAGAFSWTQGKYAAVVKPSGGPAPGRRCMNFDECGNYVTRAVSDICEECGANYSQENEQR